MEIKEILLVLGNIMAFFTAIIGIKLSLVTAKKTQAERDKVIKEGEKTAVDAAAIITDTAMNLLETINKKVDLLECKVIDQDVIILKLQDENGKQNHTIESLENENKSFKVAICKLINQLKENKITPIWDELDCTQILTKKGA